MRAVPMVIHWVAVVVDEVVPVDIIDKPVAVVVDTVPGDLARIRPDVRHQVGVRVVNASIDYANDNVDTACGDIPCFGRVNVRIGRPARLTGVVHSPQLGKVGVIRDCLNRKDGIRLEISNVRIGSEPVDYLVDIRAMHRNENLPGHAESTDNLETHFAAGEEANGVGNRGDAANRLVIELDDPPVRKSFDSLALPLDFLDFLLDVKH